jgi:hypothetical protein
MNIVLDEAVDDNARNDQGSSKLGMVVSIDVHGPIVSVKTFIVSFS